MSLFGGSSPRKNTKAARIRKLKSKIKKAEKKKAQERELISLQKKWEGLRR